MGNFWIACTSAFWESPWHWLLLVYKDDAVVAFLDRRPLFYQISVEWIPLLHDRGYELVSVVEENVERLFASLQDTTTTFHGQLMESESRAVRWTIGIGPSSFWCKRER